SPYSSSYSLSPYASSLPYGPSPHYRSPPYEPSHGSAYSQEYHPHPLISNSQHNQQQQQLISELNAQLRKRGKKKRQPSRGHVENFDASDDQQMHGNTEAYKGLY